MTCGLRLTLHLEPEETNQPNGNIMNSQFDEMTKGLDKSATRRAALKKFGDGFAGLAPLAFGLANKAQAQGLGRGGAKTCQSDADCPKSKPFCRFDITTGKNYCSLMFGTGGAVVNKTPLPFATDPGSL